MPSNLVDIRKESWDSQHKDNRNRFHKSTFTRLFLYYFIPLVTSIILVALKQFLDKESIQYFITGIAIFAGLFFNLLVVVSDKTHARLEYLNSEYEPTSSFTQDYKLEAERLVASITYAIMISIIVIGLMFLTQMKYEMLSKVNVNIKDIVSIKLISDIVLNFLSYFIGFKFLILIVHILKSIYNMFIIDMNPQCYQNVKKNDLN